MLRASDFPPVKSWIILTACLPDRRGVKINFHLPSTAAAQHHPPQAPSVLVVHLSAAAPETPDGACGGHRGWWAAPRGAWRWLTLLRALGPHGGDAGVQHVIDGRVTVEAPLHVVLAVRLVALLVAAVLQTVPLQVLECGAAGRDTAVTNWVGQAGSCCPAVRPAVLL